MTWQNGTLSHTYGRSILNRPIIGRPMTLVLHSRAECLKTIDIAFRCDAEGSGVLRQPSHVDDSSQEKTAESSTGFRNSASGFLLDVKLNVGVSTLTLGAHVWERIHS